MPQTACVSIELVSVSCPQCGEIAIYSRDNGSTSLTVEDLLSRLRNKNKDTMNCWSCGETLIVPKRVVLREY